MTCSVRDVAGVQNVHRLQIVIIVDLFRHVSSFFSIFILSHHFHRVSSFFMIFMFFIIFHQVSSFHDISSSFRISDQVSSMIFIIFQHEIELSPETLKRQEKQHKYQQRQTKKVPESSLRPS